MMTAVKTNKVICRQQQFHLLSSIVKSNTSTVSGIFIYGHASTGKSLVIRSVLQELKIHYVEVNCVECMTPRLVFEYVLRQLQHKEPSLSNGYQNECRCLNMSEFVYSLKKILPAEEMLVLVFSKAERLRNMDITCLPALLRLQELTSRKIIVILESTIIWEKYRTGTGCLEPFSIFFPQYSQEEAAEILMLNSPKDVSKEFYCNYINLILGVFFHVCRNICELRHLALTHFSKYIKPVRLGEVNEENVIKLLKNIEPELKKSVQTIYQHIHSGISSDAQNFLLDKKFDAAQSAIPADRQQLELPYFTKFLLIAAYIASYNPSKTDRRFFVKNTGKMSKRSRINAKKQQSERTSAHLLGPKQFPVDRLMAIFYSIIEDKVAPTALLFTQISTLTTLGLLTPVSCADQLDSPKYKCLASLETVRSISRTVGFDLIKYLYDFLS